MLLKRLSDANTLTDSRSSSISESVHIKFGSFCCALDIIYCYCEGNVCNKPARDFLLAGNLFALFPQQHQKVLSWQETGAVHVA